MDSNPIHLYISLIFTFLVYETSMSAVMDLPVPIMDPDAPCDSIECGPPQTVDVVMNGKVVTDATRFPWIVNFMEKKNTKLLFCGGMLISRKFVLTAAHCIDIEDKRSDDECSKENGSKECFRSPDSIYVGLLLRKQSDEIDRVEVKRIIPHPEYTPETFVNDIALVELKEEVGCTKMPTPICLPFMSLSKMGQNLTIAGWGKYDKNAKAEQKLMEGELRQIDEDECLFPMVSGRKIICAVGNETNQASCEGDSGSAVFAAYPTDVGEQYFALGVTSVGPPDCGPDEPDTYTDIFAYRTWIESVAEKLPKSNDEKQNKDKKKKKEE